MQENKLDTKTRILNTALRLFAVRGVENVSMRDIATAVGIKAASIYNHYVNKEQIVDACYDFFFKYHDFSQLNKERYTRILQKGTKEEVVNIPNDHFPEGLTENSIYSMIVLFSRIYTDEKAIERYTKLVDHSIRFLKEFFDLGIKLGRFEKFNVRGVAMLFFSAKLFAAQSTTIHPEALSDWSKAHQEMTSELMNMIPFKY